MLSDHVLIWCLINTRGYCLGFGWTSKRWLVLVLIWNTLRRVSPAQADFAQGFLHWSQFWLIDHQLVADVDSNLEWRKGHENAPLPFERNLELGKKILLIRSCQHTHTYACRCFPGKTITFLEEVSCHATDCVMEWAETRDLANAHAPK